MKSETPAYTTVSTSLDFLSAGGQMGERMLAHDWQSTPFGPSSGWPQSLRSALSICLGSSFPIAIYWGPDLALLYNDQWSEIPGNKHPWALGRPGREVWPEIWDTIGPMFAKVLSTGEATRSKDELLAMHRRGFTEECYFDYTFSPIRDEAGAVGGIFNIAVETTFRVIGERRARLLKDVGEFTARARTAAEACTLAASALASNPADLPFCLIYLVDSAHNGASLNLEAAVGIPAGSPANPDKLEPTAADPVWPIAEVLTRRTPVLVNELDRRFPIALPGGPWPEPCRRAVVVPLPNLGAADCVGVMVAGISPRLVLDTEYQAFFDRAAALTATAIANARAYEEERRRADALAELDRAKTLFFSNISHEFRTPLTLMLGPVEDILSKPDADVPADDRELLKTVQRSGLRLQRLVNMLLDFSRIEAGRVQANYEPTDLSVFTAELASTFRSAMGRAGLQFTVECAALAKPVYVDREMWEKIVLNLVSNAFKYTLEGSVRVRLQESAWAVELSVEDTGVGIPEHELPHLFERFYRVEGTRGRTNEGTGIGLALVQELVKLHGGTVTATSQPGAGSQFRVCLPFGTSHLPVLQLNQARQLSSTAVHADAYVQEALRWLPDSESAFSFTGTSDSPAASQSGTRSRVLLADDNADMRDYIRRLLSGRYDVTACSNGEEALAAALANPPDLVLTDVMMPVLDGFGLLRELRRSERTKTLPILLLSARAGEESRVEGLDAGADDYLVKPFTAREMLARVEAHLSLARMRRQADQARRLSEVRLGLALEATRMFAWEWDADKDEVVSAGDMATVFGSALHSAGDGFRHIHPDDLTAHRSKVERLKREGGTYRSEFRIRRSDTGTTSWLEEHAAGIPDESGRISRIVGVIADVTERKTAEEELHRKNEELTKANRELEEFAYVASHDLQEPLRMISIYTQLLLRTIGSHADPNVVEYAGFVRKGVLRMEELIKDLLVYSRTVHPEQEAPCAADLNQSLDEALAVLRVRLEETGAKLVRRPLPVVWGDERQIALVFQNLLSNALKYRKSDVAPRIEIQAENGGPEWVVKVRDNGIGFHPRHAQWIFGLFRRLHKDAYPGTGMGLAISKRIVERYGGRVWAESEGEGKGAIFCFSLRPAKQ